MRTRCLNRWFEYKENQLYAMVPVESFILDME